MDSATQSRLDWIPEKSGSPNIEPKTAISVELPNPETSEEAGDQFKATERSGCNMSRKAYRQQEVKKQPPPIVVEAKDSKTKIGTE